MRFSLQLFILFTSIALLVTPSSYALERATEYLRTLEETNVGVGLVYDRDDFGTDQTSYYFQVPLSISYRKNDYLLELWVPFAATNAITENIIIGNPKRGGGSPAGSPYIFLFSQRLYRQ